MSSSFTKRVTKEIQLYQKDNFSFPNLILQPSESLDIWYFIIHDLKDTEYEGGIYLGKVILPPKYPFKAPDFQFITKSGRFEINKKICTSFTAFHNELYSPSWNIASMCAGLTSFMTDPDNNIESKGLGGILMSKEERQKIAQESLNIITKNDIYQKYFSQYKEILKLV
jgi:ubiquitin-protein ligase